MSNILRGTILITGANYLSKILGILYVIPFEALVTGTALSLFSFAYTPYTILISISTMGIPLAMSKFVSKYNTLGDYQTGRRMFQAAFKVMMVTGILAFLLLFFSSDFIAKIAISEEETNFPYSVEEVSFVIKMVSFALLIIPAMSIMRGFFQGYGSMGPSAVSTVMEQIVRIIFLLGSVFLVLKVLGGTVTNAIGMATFATFVGAIGSLFVLGYFWKMRKPYLDQQLNAQKTKTRHFDSKGMFKELLSYAGPFVLVGLATPIYQLIDQFTFPRAMAAIDLGGETAALAYSVIVLLGHKLVIIPVTLATGLSLALLPVITSSFTAQKRDLYIQQINQSLQIIMLIIIPASVGLSILGNEAYGSFYGIEDLTEAGPLLSWYAPVSLFFGLFTVTASILQGINKQSFALISLGVGVIIKLVCNMPFVYLFEAKGAIFATGIAVLTASTLNLWKIKHTINMPFKPLYKRTLLIFIFTGVMAIVVFFLKWIFTTFVFEEASRISSIVITITCVGIGGYIYMWLSYKATLLERVLGSRANVLKRFFI
ncbi:Membrane protein involved in the export of O-antigen and teichoic acid [Salinibacillus kushneri]|uniref:Membrane protein involved in the export of O-antigen and teichoic acid n=1 Tax=Salinibacillus kushneri TaxID=237682 RepID=A0A1I0JDK6_9BACI|nr:polysaccharide biosynthesis protein [Salinibacillus kushneri]SEU08069.1 Membrane protein involved in the export of O-antigen and teichoic acid [Salinibacillus kushneri]